MIAKVTITRPSGTTAYTAKDVINENGVTTPIEIKCPYVGNNIYVLGSTIISSNPSGTPARDILLFSSSFTIAADNAAFNPDSSDSKSHLGKISHTSWINFASSKFSDAKPEKPISLQPLPNPGDKIYLVLLDAGGETPIASEEITIVLHLSY